MSDQDESNVQKIKAPDGSDIPAKILYMQIYDLLNESENLTYFTLIGVLDTLKHSLKHEGDDL